ncbi:MAG: hypothetical protein FJZ01_16520 [Candidatus Sericytochromatia bacterium]|nr:hypothetical protein [Candidatus Tanganyikabacteria bacterium]
MKRKRARLLWSLCGVLLTGCLLPFDAKILLGGTPGTGGDVHSPAAYLAPAESGAATPANPAAVAFIRGQVRDEGGRGIAGATVTAYVARGPAIVGNNSAGFVDVGTPLFYTDAGTPLHFTDLGTPLFYRATAVAVAPARAVSDASGHFLLGVQATGSFNLEAALGADLKAWRSEVAVPSADATGDAGAMALGQLGALSGSITASSGPADLSGIHVFIPGSGYATKTAADGKFSLLGLPRGSFRIGAYRPDLGVGALAAPVEVLPGKVTASSPVRLEAATGAFPRPTSPPSTDPSLTPSPAPSTQQSTSPAPAASPTPQVTPSPTAAPSPTAPPIAYLLSNLVPDCIYLSGIAASPDTSGSTLSVTIAPLSASGIDSSALGGSGFKGRVASSPPGFEARAIEVGTLSGSARRYRILSLNGYNTAGVAGDYPIAAEMRYGNGFTHVMYLYPNYPRSQVDAAATAFLIQTECSGASQTSTVSAALSGTVTIGVTGKTLSFGLRDVVLDDPLTPPATVGDGVARLNGSGAIVNPAGL